MPHNHEVADALHIGLSPALSGAATDVLRGDGTYGSVPGVGVWSAFTPTRTGWTDIGTPTVTGRKCQIGNMCFFQVQVIPATTTATVAGTSYIALPITAGASGLCGDVSMMNLTTLVGVGSGVIDVANSRAYVPSQGATGNTLTIFGQYEV